MKKIMIAVLIGALVTAGMSGTALAKNAKYAEGEVKNGGKITGVISFKGKVPDPIMEDLTKGKNAEFCATHPDTVDGHIRPRHKVVVNDGMLKDAVVYIHKIESGKAWSKETINFDFKTCDIFPKVSIVRKTPKDMKEGLVTVTNQDDNTLHNPHGYSVNGANRKTLFNKPLPSKGSIADVTKNMKRFKMKKDRHFFLQCDQHNYMEADGLIVWNPYYNITGKDGKFVLDQVPPGKYKVIAWHPYAGESSQEVTVTAGQDANANFEIASN